MSDEQLEMAPIVRACRASLSQQIKGHLWIVAFPVLAGAEAQAKVLLSLGAERVLAVGVSAGVRSPELLDEGEKLNHREIHVCVILSA